MLAKSGGKLQELNFNTTVGSQGELLKLRTSQKTISLARSSIDSDSALSGLARRGKRPLG
jgi:hypothetical protein